MVHGNVLVNVHTSVSVCREHFDEKKRFYHFFSKAVCEQRASVTAVTHPVSVGGFSSALSTSLTHMHVHTSTHKHTHALTHTHSLDPSVLRGGKCICCVFVLLFLHCNKI